MSGTHTENTGDALVRLMIGCLLFRLGGEQSFTLQEISDIRHQVAGVQVLLTEDERILVKVRTNESYQDLKQQGVIEL